MWPRNERDLGTRADFDRFWLYQLVTTELEDWGQGLHDCADIPVPYPKRILLHRIIVRRCKDHSIADYWSVALPVT